MSYDYQMHEVLKRLDDLEKQNKELKDMLIAMVQFDGLRFHMHHSVQSGSQFIKVIDPNREEG